MVLHYRCVTLGLNLLPRTFYSLLKYQGNCHVTSVLWSLPIQYFTYSPFNLKALLALRLNNKTIL